MEGFDRPWWTIGGWSLEVFTGIGRDHEDMDISILSSDAGAFREFLGDQVDAVERRRRLVPPLRPAIHRRSPR